MWCWPPWLLAWYQIIVSSFVKQILTLISPQSGGESNAQMCVWPWAWPLPANGCSPTGIVVIAGRKYKTDLSKRRVQADMGEGHMASCGNIWGGHLGPKSWKEVTDLHAKSRNDEKTFLIYHAGKMECFTKTQGWSKIQGDAAIIHHTVTQCLKHTDLSSIYRKDVRCSLAWLETKILLSIIWIGMVKSQTLEIRLNQWMYWYTWVIMQTQVFVAALFIIAELGSEQEVLQEVNG